MTPSSTRLARHGESSSLNPIQSPQSGCGTGRTSVNPNDRWYYPFLGRVTLALAGAINTVFCTWLLGERSGTELFLIPCAMLASLLFGASERRWMLTLAALPLCAYIFLHGNYGAPPYLYRSDAYAALFSMNAFSVGTLSIFLGIVFSGLYAGPAART
jgi:hypothetical protein